MQTRRLFDPGLRAFYILAMKKTQQLTVVRRDPYGLALVCFEKITNLLEFGIRPERRRPGHHHLFRDTVGLRFDLFCTNLAKQHFVLVQHGA
jgi:hypothetical protein